MQFNIFKSQSGKPTFTVNGLMYHSRYDPEREAKKFIRNILADSDYRDSTDSPKKYFIILGCGLGFICKAIKELFPQSFTIGIYYANTIFQSSFFKPDAWWIDGNATPLIDFLKHILNELDISDTKLLEWPVSSKIFEDRANILREEIAQVIREYTGNYRTTYFLGRRWIRNSFKNFLTVEKPVKNLFLGNDKIPIIVASGPSLESSLETLKKRRGALFILALPSSVSVLKSFDIYPDIVVITDPGFYTKYHLSYLGMNSARLVALSLISAFGTETFAKSTLLFSNDSYPERLIFASAGITPLIFPSQGTVAATALSLASLLGSRTVVTVGLDLCYFDIKSHARNGSNHFFHIIHQNRLHPLYGEMLRFAFDKTKAFTSKEKVTYRSNDSLRAYAGWFSSNMKNFSNIDIYRLNPSPAYLDNLQCIDTETFESIVSQYQSPSRGEIDYAYFDSYPVYGLRLAILRKLISKWKESLEGVKKRINDDFPASDVLISEDFVSLSYYTDIHLLHEIKRAIALENEEEAKMKVIQLAEENINFVSSLEI